MSNLDRFELFTQVAQLGSLTQVAHKLNLTKAALSKQIKKLEEEIQVDLFTRNRQRLKLTNEGSILFEQCLKLDNELKNTWAVCRQFHDEPEGKLYVTVFEYFVNKLIFPRLAEFLQLYPKLELIIDTNERVVNFEEEYMDLAVGFSLPFPDNVTQRSMYTTRYVLCTSPAYLNQYGTPARLQDLHDHRYICHKARLQYGIRLKPGYSLNPTPYLVLNRVVSMIECAKHGLGLIQLPLYMLESSLENGELVEVLPEYQAVNASVYCYYLKHRYTQPKIRKFIDFFLS